MQTGMNYYQQENENFALKIEKYNEERKRLFEEKKHQDSEAQLL